MIVAIYPGGDWKYISLPGIGAHTNYIIFGIHANIHLVAGYGNVFARKMIKNTFEKKIEKTVSIINFRIFLKN